MDLKKAEIDNAIPEVWRDSCLHRLNFHYEDLKTSTGSVRIAFLAGIKIASKATPIRKSDATLIVNGSNGLTP
jgi:hypothetical protein